MTEEEDWFPYKQGDEVIKCFPFSRCTCGHERRMHFGMGRCQAWTGRGATTLSPDCRCEYFTPKPDLNDPEDLF